MAGGFADVDTTGGGCEEDADVMIGVYVACVEFEPLLLLVMFSFELY